MGASLACDDSNDPRLFVWMKPLADLSSSVFTGCEPLTLALPGRHTALFEPVPAAALDEPILGHDPRLVLIWALM